MKNQYLLAFKGVNKEMKSLFITGKLCRQYAVGKVMRADKRFPFFLVSCYNAVDTVLMSGADDAVDKVLLVKVNKKDLNYDLPWITQYDEYGKHLKLGNLSLDELYKLNDPGMSRHGVGANKLKVLEVFDMHDFETVLDAKNHYTSKYKMNFVPICSR